MLRNRPLVPSESFIAAPRIAPTTRHHHPLVVIPKGPASTAVNSIPAAPESREAVASRPYLLDDLLRLSTHKLSAFLAEAAVLVLVLGILERFLAAHHLELRWLALILTLSATLLAVSILVELTGTRRAGHS